MSKYAEFTFEDLSFSKNTGELCLNYSFGGEEPLTERLLFDTSKVNFAEINEKVLYLAFSNLHLAGGVSYYKAFCPKKLSLSSGSLSKEQASFWNKFYTKGLAEFFYTNSLDPEGLIDFPFENDFSPEPAIALSLSKNTLVPIGGGKDSIVSAELLRKGEIPFKLFSLNDAPAIRACSERIGKERIVVKRELSPRLFELNATGALNGHVPITGYISFLLIAACVLYNQKYVVMSLEKSADDVQVMAPFGGVNHQYSKSAEFEEDFRAYVRDFITPSISFFSLLRPYYELKIGELFSRFSEKYLDVFTSCNTNFRQKPCGTRTLWCGMCAKCAFVFAILAPFFSREEIVQIFGKDLFDDPELLETYRALLGLKTNRPFECIGTEEEIKCALSMAHERGDWAGSVALSLFEKEVMPGLENIKAIEQELLKAHPCTCIPEKFGALLSEL